MDLTTEVYKLYKYWIYRRIPEYRGMTRIASFLEDLCMRGHESIDDDEVLNLNDADWDHLVILDGCRHDLYQEVGGDVDYRISVASCTPNYISETFSNRDYSDTVLVTANPWFSKQTLPNIVGDTNPFCCIFRTFEHSWSPDEKVVLPSDLVEEAKAANALFPNKRLIVHFMQPHQPFIGYDMEGGGRTAPSIAEEELKNVWTEAEKGNYERDYLWEAYKHNLEVAMTHVEKLVENLEGRIAITSDHGNIVGEGGLFGHPCGKDYKCLRKVPWDVRE